MFAINHATTALLVKRGYPEVPLPWLLGSVQATELLWVALNAIGLERTTTEATVASVADIHLAHMPWSHSLLGTGAVAAGLGAIAGVAGGRRAAIAVGLGVLSHVVLDVLTHAPDIALTPWSDVEIGLGLYAASPMAAWALELLFGLACWAVWGGGARLLAVIVGFNVANLTLMSAALPGPEALMADRPGLVVAAVAAQIVVTLFLVHRAAAPTTPRLAATGPGLALLIALGLAASDPATAAVPTAPAAGGKAGLGLQAGTDGPPYGALVGSLRLDGVAIGATAGLTTAGGWRSSAEVAAPALSSGPVSWTVGLYTRSLVQRAAGPAQVDVLGTVGALVERDRISAALLAGAGPQLALAVEPAPGLERAVGPTASLRLALAARIAEGWSLGSTAGVAWAGSPRPELSAGVQRRWGSP